MINFRLTLCQRRISESEMCIKWRRKQLGIVKNSWKDHWGCYQENFSPNWNKYVELKIYHNSMSKRSLGTAVSFVCLWFTVKNLVEYLKSSLLHCRFVPHADIEQKNCWSHFNSKCQGKNYIGEAFLRTFHRFPFWFYVPQTTALKLQTFKMWLFPWLKVHNEIRIWPVNLSHSAEEDYRIKCSFYGWQKTFLIGCWRAGQLRRQKFEWKPSACFRRLKNKKINNTEQHMQR